jgi:hypothetical protein
MPIHDVYARRTPYELSFPSVSWARDAFTAVRGEGDAREIDVRDPDLFILLGSVGRMLQELRPDEADPERIHPLGLLLYHAFHFWRAGESILLVETPVARRLVEGEPPAAGGTVPPGEAGYVQLPQHLFWMDAEAGGAPESVDGFFWTAPGPGGEIHVLLAAGIRGDRPGFSVVPVPPASLGRAEEWVDDEGGGGGDFRSPLPGAELDRLYRLGTPGEVLRLVSRLFGLLSEERPGAVEAPGAAASNPPATSLPYRRIQES